MARTYLKRLYANCVRQFRSSIRTRIVNGDRISLGKRTRPYFAALRTTAYEPLEWLPIVAFAESGQTFVDVGANVGLLTIAMSRRVGGGGRVVAAEPQPDVLALARENAAINGCRNVEFFGGVFGHRTGSAEFYVSSATNLGVSSSVACAERESHRILVPSETIDNYFRDTARLDYLKIDAEGAEVDILRGAGESLHRHRPLVQVEVHGQYLPRFGYSVRDVFSTMEEAGYVALNLVTRQREALGSFLEDTQYRVLDRETGDDLSRRGYGQLLFVHESRASAAERRLVSVKDQR